VKQGGAERGRVKRRKVCNRVQRGRVKQRGDCNRVVQRERRGWSRKKSTTSYCRGGVGACRGRVERGDTERGRGAVEWSVRQGARGTERKRLSRRESAKG
jgi:hypothetical protein